MRRNIEGRIRKLEEVTRAKAAAPARPTRITIKGLGEFAIPIDRLKGTYSRADTGIPRIEDQPWYPGAMKDLTRCASLMIVWSQDRTGPVAIESGFGPRMDAVLNRGASDIRDWYAAGQPPIYSAEPTTDPNGPIVPSCEPIAKPLFGPCLDLIFERIAEEQEAMGKGIEARLRRLELAAKARADALHCEVSALSSEIRYRFLGNKTIEEDAENPLIDQYMSELFSVWGKLTFEPPTYHLSPGEPAPPAMPHELRATEPHFDADLQALIEAGRARIREFKQDPSTAGGDPLPGLLEATSKFIDDALADARWELEPCTPATTSI